MNDYCTPGKTPRAIVFCRRVFFPLCFFLIPLLGKAQFSLNFECGISSSVDAAMIGTTDSTEATIVIPGDISLIDSILVEIVVKGNPVFWGSTTVTTSEGEVVVIPFPGLITNTGSNEEAAIYRAWVGPCQFLTATTPVVDPLHYDDWQSMTTFQVRGDTGCLSGTSSDGDILLFHACDTFYFDLDSVIAPFKDVSIIAPLSEIGDVDTTRSAIVVVNYIHEGVVTNVSIDTFYGNDNLGDNALLYQNNFSVPGDVDTIEIIFISPDGVFSNTSCTQQVPFGGDSFVVGTVVVSSACDECCTVIINCDTIPDNYLCSFDLVPPIPAALLDDTVVYAGNVNLDSLAYAAFGGSYTTTFCDTVYIIGSDEVTGEGCPGDTGYVFRTFVFYDFSDGTAVDTCELTYIIIDTIAPTLTCPPDTTLQCNTENYPPHLTLTLFLAAGGAASDDCALDPTSFTFVGDSSDGQICPETISRKYSIADSCGNVGTCIQIITLIDTLPPSITCPDDITLDCFDFDVPESTGFAIAADECDPNPDLTYVDFVTPGICQVEYTITRTWFASDTCGNVTTCIQTIVVDDSAAPILSVPDDVSIQCGDEPTGDATAVDLCTSAFVTYVDLQCSVTVEGFTGAYDFSNWTAVEPNGGSVVTQDSTEVTLTSPDGSGCDGESTLFSITVPEDGKLIFSWNYSTDDVDPFFDPFGYNLNGTFVQLTDENGPITQSGLAAALVTAGDVFSFEQHSTDCIFGSGATTVVDFFVYTCSEAEPENPCNYTVFRCWSATDECGNTAYGLQRIHVEDTTPPTFEFIPENTTIECDEEIVFTDPIVFDNCSDEVDLTYSEMTGSSVTGTLLGINEVPPNGSPATGTVIGGIDLTANMIFICVEFSGLVAPTTAAHIHMAPAGVNGPVIVPLGIPVGVTSGSFDGSAILTDAQESALLSEGLYLNIHTTAFPGGEIRDQLSVPECSNTFKRLYVATDSCGNTSTACVTITTVDTTPPEITCPSDATIEWVTPFVAPDTVETGSATATDNCMLESLTYMDSDLIPQTDPCNPFYLIRTWKATDTCGLMTTCTQRIDIVDTTPPEITCPPDATIEWVTPFIPPAPGVVGPPFCDQATGQPGYSLDLDCQAAVCEQDQFCCDVGWDGICAGQAAQFEECCNCLQQPTCPGTGIAIATDNCLVASLMYSDSDLIPQTDPCNPFYLIRTWKATDACGLMTTCTQRIDIVDTTPPEITCPPDVTIEWVTPFVAPDPSNPGGPPFCDLATGQLGFPSDQDCQAAVCAEDAFCCDVSWDGICAGEAVQFEECCNCLQQPTCPVGTGVATATDNCFVADLTYSDSDLIPQTDPCNPFYLIRTWKATDACGLMTTCTQRIDIVDTTPPELTCPPGGDFVCDEGMPFYTTLNDFLGAGGNVSDNCAIDSASFTLVGGTGVGPCPTVFTFLYSITDLCGNLASCIHVVTVTDDIPPSITCPDDIVVECIDEVPAALTSVEEFIAAGGNVFDNCALDSLSFTSNDLSDGLTCPETITRTYSIADFCGNVSTCVQTITVDDTTPPVITCSADITIECSDPVPPGLASASDNCDPEVLILPASSITPGDCADEFIIFRSWVATDECGNTSICTQIVTIVDTTPPTITCPDDVTIECTFIEPGEPIFAGEPIVADNCDNELLVTFIDVTEPGACPQEFTIFRTWYTEDNCGNVSSCLQTIVIDDSTAPSLTLPDDITIQCGDEPTGDASAVDNCSDEVFVTYVDLQCSVTVEGFTDAYDFANWTSSIPDGGDIITNGTTDVTLVSADNQGCSGESTLFSIVVPEDGKIVFAWNYETLDDGPVFDPFGYNINGVFVQLTNNNGPLAQSGLAAALVSVGDVFAFDQRSTDCILGSGATTVIDFFVYTCAEEEPADPCNYTTFRCWSATDECGNTAYALQQIHVEDTELPSITCPDDVTLECLVEVLPFADLDEFIAAGGSVSDNCSIDSSSFTVVEAIAIGPCPYVFTFTYAISDSCGNSSVCNMTIVTDDTVPPSITCPDDVSDMCSVDGFPIATSIEEFIAQGGNVFDNCELDSASFTLVSEVPNGETCPMIITRIYSVSDLCGNTSTCEQDLFVDDTTPPVVDCPDGITVSCTGDLPLCPADIAAFIALGGSASDNCDANLDFSCSAGPLVGGTCGGTVTYTMSFTDDCDNTATCTWIVTVDDNTPPMIVCPANTMVSCASQVPLPGGAMASDNCPGTVMITNMDVITNMTCANRFTLTRTYTATDLCGNTATCAQIITVNDVTPPMIMCPPPAVTVPGMTTPATTGTPTTSDNCGGTVTTGFNDVIIPGDCMMQFTINRTWTATDLCGNTASCLQVITVDGECEVDLELTKDTETCVVNPGDDIVYTITVSNDGEIAIGSLTITDYIPVGLVLNDPDWTAGNAGSTGQSASIVLSIANGGLDPTGLDPGESVTVEITLQVPLGTLSGAYTNTAEISVTLDLEGNDVSNLDIDSDPDQDDTNDPVGEDDIDDVVICVTFTTEIAGDNYVCPGDIVTYVLTSPYNPNNTYTWTLQNGGGVIIDVTDTTITIQWQNSPGGAFVIWLTESSGVVGCGGACAGGADFFVYIQGIEPIACNDHVNISLGPECELQLLSGMILEGEQFDNNGYFVIITDQNGNVIPNATLTGDHVGQLFNVTVMSECNGQSCWGTIWVEDKLPPQITCTDVTLFCGESTEPVYIPVIEGTANSSTSPGTTIGPDAGAVTSQNLQINAPDQAQVTDVNITISLTHTWSDDLDVFLIAPNGNSVELATDVCGANDNWANVTFDDEALVLVTGACVAGPPTLTGDVRPEGFLSDFDGIDADGTWTLEITDDAGGDQGILQSVSLEIAYFVALPYAATASDACGDVTLDYEDVETGEDCEGQQILRTWTATDESGNTAQCLQTITILPLNLDGLEFPENYEGSCGGSSHPNVTGWPTVDGVEIVDFVCNIFLTWEDHPLADCGGGTKIVRTWTVFDWCTLEIQEGVQVIKLTDNEAPLLYCPDDQTVGTNPWFCYTDVVLTLPEAVDVCGTPFTLTPSVSSGVLVHFGGNIWRVDDLLVGTHTVTWTAEDACGNSSTCSYDITIVDDVPPVPICDEHTIVTLTNDDPLDEGLTKVYAETFDDGSYDNCGPVTFLVRRMPPSCIDFDWIGHAPLYPEYPNNDGGAPETVDQGLTFQPWAPFACCDVGQTIMVELRITDLYGNINSCMVEIEVQDKLPPLIVCPPDITVSCDFWFDAHETDGFEPEDGLEDVFGRVLDAYDYHESDREYVIVDDPGNNELPQPYHWGLDGWADDNCDVTIDVRTRLFDDCSGDDLPGGAPNWAVRLVERTFRAQDGQGNTSTCRQRIWVVDFDPFYISDQVCGLNNADDVRWPCDLTLTNCPAGNLTPDDLSAYAPNNRPIVNDDNCSLIGVTYEDQVFYFEDGACRKILREWTVIDWCQFDAQEHTGYWTYTQVIKILDTDPAEFTDCPAGPLTFCVEDENVELPANNQVFLGEDDPNSSACSVHIWLTQTVYETCSEQVFYDVKVYPFNESEYVQVVARTEVPVDSLGNAVLTFDTRSNSLPSNHPIRRYGLPYNDNVCSNWPLAGGSKDYHRILWSVEDGCGNVNSCEYLFRLEDCKKPSPVCVGLSSVVMPSSGSVTIWAKDFDASSFDDCTAHEDLLFSFSGTTYQPSRVFDCAAIEANGSPSFLVEIWVGDEGNDQNCNGFIQPLGIEWSERNKDYCTTFIVIDDNEGVCGDSLTGGVIETEETESVEKVTVRLTDQNGQVMNTYVTDKDGLYHFINPLFDYTIEPGRDDNHKNGVSTLDLVAIQKHLLGLQPLNSPYKMIAADANNSESVSAIDLVEIRKLILGLYTKFPKNTSWRFVDGSFDFADPAHPWPFDEVIESHSGMTMNEDFVGVKIGDVNGTVAANANQIVTRGARNVLELMIEDRQVKQGEIIHVPVSSANYKEMLGYQFTMNLNGLTYTGIEPGVITMQPEFVGVHNSAITMSWGATHELTTTNDEVLFTLHFVAASNGSLKEMIDISSEITEAEAYTTSGEDITLMDVAIVFNTTAVSTGIEYALYQNEPNPFTDQTVIGFELPEAMPATVTLYDMSGKVIRVVDGDYAKGYNEVVLKRKDLVASGAYYYHLQAGDFTASKKMILSK